MINKTWLAALTGIVLTLGIGASLAQDNKANIAFDSIGEGAEKVLVLHDWLGDRSNYELVKPYLDLSRYTYTFIDLRGYGESRDIPGKYNAEEAAEDVVSVADALGWSTFHIVGHSMSGMIVQRVALNVPDRVLSVVATSPVAASGMAIDEDTWQFFSNVVTDEATAGNAISGLTGNKLSPGWVNFKVRRAMETSTVQARLDYLDMFVKSDFSSEAIAANLQTPFLLILGENDFPAFQPEAVESTFLSWYPNTQIATIANAGHYAMQETPALFAAIVENFLNEQTTN